MRPTFHIMTFGCQMNVGDSDWLAGTLVRRGFEPSSLEEAELVILNTCSVREKSEQKVYSALGRIVRAMRGDPRSFVALAGCVAQQLGESIFDRFPKVRLVLGGDGLVFAPDAIERLRADPNARLCFTDFSADYVERPLEIVSGARVAKAAAFVNIMQGCDNFCAYCIVPSTRGKPKSRTVEAVLAECRARLEAGARELVLLGQNVNAFGQDAAGGHAGFAELLRRVAALPGLARLRFVTSHPKDFSPELIRAFGELEALCPRLHLPLQAGADQVLARMGRKYDREHYLKLVGRLRAARPDLAFSTDVIVGFPGESEEDFQETLGLMEEVNFMSSFSFCYSDRPGAAAERMPGKLDAQSKLERLARLQALQERLSGVWLQGRVGSAGVVLLEGASSKPSSRGEAWRGRDPYGATVNIILPAGVGSPGMLLPVRVIEAKKHSLLAVSA
ncbi:MAG: tRNA (N6-isopentenyl adenosine(37)-C2)-methylthiotransferase MiaB [Deltaproteobacteria bacterium]|jgi:tRNA-2-methylthio-N6-dimethylallyladenosine synthase|nr:tRNA (N6-isopentenyl adenosine(37)-C2)-methylthiotransferase MiaB [Deltaproteobacteria bacterium]